MIGVRVPTVADEFCKNSCLTAYSVLVALQNQDCSSFANYKTIAFPSPGPRSLLRCFIACVQGSHRGESSDSRRTDSRLGSRASHDIAVTSLDYRESLSHSIAAVP